MTKKSLFFIILQFYIFTHNILDLLLNAFNVLAWYKSLTDHTQWMNECRRSECYCCVPVWFIWFPFICTLDFHWDINYLSAVPLSLSPCVIALYSPFLMLLTPEVKLTTVQKIEQTKTTDRKTVSEAARCADQFSLSFSVRCPTLAGQVGRDRLLSLRLIHNMMRS